jgi:hypothetical protein
VPVPASRPPLLFSLRWPAEWDVDEPASSGDVLPPGGSALGRLRAWVRTSAAITTQRLTLRLPRPGEGVFVVAAALSVALADVGELPPAEEMGDGATEVTAGGYEGMRIRSLRAAPPADSGPAPRMLVVRFMLSTPVGMLALAFSAAQPDFYDLLEPLFDQVADTVRLDPFAPERVETR